jgi:hypothetical protein
MISQEYAKEDTICIGPTANSSTLKTVKKKKKVLDLRTNRWE